ncbi:MAG: DUF929 family protein [Actinomycetota bacterium]
MSASGSREQAARNRQQKLEAVQASQRQRRRLVVAGGAVAGVAVLIAIVIGVGLATGGTHRKQAAAPPSGAATAALAQLAGMPAATLVAIGVGDVENPVVLADQPALTEAGKPLAVYIGAEYCPFCAAQRWPVVQALSRFGTWSNLAATTSAADDSFPNTPTFSFHGATYTSDYLAFQGVETETNKRGAKGYQPLDAVTDAQAKLLETYNAPPYVPKESAGTIPFLDFGNRFAVSGSSFSPQLLQGKTMQQITAALADPKSPIARGIGGASNMLTAAICEMTNGKPVNVCDAADISAIRGHLRDK